MTPKRAPAPSASASGQAALASPPVPVLILTGLSGSGKSTALRALEDAGYFCIDNLPLSLLGPLLQKVAPPGGDGRKVALVMDVRTEGFLKNYPRVFKRLERQGYQVHLVFLEAEEAVLVRRFSQTRRQHPLADHDTISAALRQERQSLAGLQALAHRLIDTTHLNPHQLRQLIMAQYSRLSERERMILHLSSFSYQRGVPPDADLVVDVRFLPNPYFVEELREATGLEPAVQDFVLGQEVTREFLARLTAFLDFLLPLYQKEGKTHLNLAIGCTGGRHRSVVIAHYLSRHLARQQYQFTLHHRELM
ncbi:MAG: RNase adapter RapZ [Syntrophobacterales bacterium]|nr:RNase adapter RapZ [Syntrophobacterales bacterium]